MLKQVAYSYVSEERMSFPLQQRLLHWAGLRNTACAPTLLFNFDLDIPLVVYILVK